MPESKTAWNEVGRWVTDKARDVVWAINSGGELEYVSENILQVRGITPAQAKKQPLQESMDIASAKRITDYFLYVISEAQAGRQPRIFGDFIEYYRASSASDVACSAIYSAAEDREKVEKIAADWNPDVNFSRAVLKGNNVSLITYLALTQDELSGSLFAYNFNTWVDEHSSFGPRLATAAN